MKTFFQLGLILTIGSFVGLSYNGTLPTTNWDSVVENTLHDTISFGTLGVADTLHYMEALAEEF